MKQSGPPQRKTRLKRSDKPLRKSGPTKAKKVARQRAFYASAAWKRLRKEALERAGHQCEYIVASDFYSPSSDTIEEFTVRCSVINPLHIHHKTNVRFGGNELLKDLQVLCSYHHRTIEARDFPHRHPRQRVG